MAPKNEIEHGSGEFTCDCGRTFTHAAWYTKHKLHCDGKPTEGRIAARERALVPVASTSRAKRAHKMSGSRPRNSDRTPPAANGIGQIQAAATDKAMEIVIAGLMAKRDRIDVAIAALEAVS